MNDIIAMIPVDTEAAQKKMPDPWKMPHEPLYRRLRERSRGTGAAIGRAADTAPRSRATAQIGFRNRKSGRPCRVCAAYVGGNRWRRSRLEPRARSTTTWRSLGRADLPLTHVRSRVRG